MIKVLLVIHLVVTVVMIGLILLQRSEGGGLGIGGGSGGLGGFAGPRATANVLTKATMICFGLFVGLSLFIGVLASGAQTNEGLLNQLSSTPVPVVAPLENGADKTNVLKNEPSESSEKPQVPVSD